MAISDHSVTRGLRSVEFRGSTAIGAVAFMIGVLFAGSTVVTPLYVLVPRDG
jgi:hypothetical protein